MKLFRSPEFAILLLDLQQFQGACDEGRRKATNRSQLVGPQFPSSPPESDVEHIKQAMEKAVDLCRDMGLTGAASQVSLMLLHLKGNEADADYSSLSADIRNACDAIISNFWDRIFIEISSEFSEYVNNDFLCGAKVNASFPSAAEDIRQAGNCIAVDSGTAAVFHLMRAVEWGLRALCAHLEVLTVQRKHSDLPIAFAERDRIITQLYPAVQKKIDALSPGTEKQELQEFYFPLLADVRGFKDAFRNHVMHTRKTYSQTEANDVLEHVNRFLKLLATRVTEGAEPATGSA